jgi:hypothetical protein
MNRRELLATTALLACAGCLGDGDDGANNDSTAEPTDGAATTAGSTETDAVDTAETTTASTDTATTSPGSTATTTGGGATGTTTEARTETPDRTTTGRTTTDGATTNGTADGSAADRSFTVVETGDEAGNEASVAIENDGSRIVVTGTITGENGCQTATLDSVRTDAGEVRLVVATERAPDAGAVCSQALVGISYRATVTVERRPESVTVIHRGAGGEETVATTEPGA